MAYVVPEIPLITPNFSSTRFSKNSATTEETVPTAIVNFTAIGFVPEGPAIMPTFGGGSGGGSQGYIFCT